MNETKIISALRDCGCEFFGYRNIGETFQEWTFEPSQGCGAIKLFRTLRQFDFYDISIDLIQDEQVRASRTLY